MRPAQWTRAEAAAHREKLLDSYRQLLSDLSTPELKTVGNYTLGRLIGKGSFGKVYLGHHKLTSGTKVVLKSACRDDPNLAREIHHHRQFVHPHIARLYEVILTESLVWLVLEYCPGDELLSYVTEHGPVEAAKVQKIFTQLVGAVSYVHGKRCVHRDLKLENILLDKNGNVKLVDFGFTREYDGKNSVLQTWCGTVCYSAPEMLIGERYAAEKVDVWSLGVILYALLAGELPFDTDDEAETRKRIIGLEPSYPDHLPDQAAKLIKKLLSKRPFVRPCLEDILLDPWLAEHAPEQRTILSRPVPVPFSTEIEHETLLRMRTAGVDVGQVMENVIAQKCDPLAGWWTVLLEKETRKAARRERRLAERERTRRLSIGLAHDRVVSPLRLDTSRSRRGSRFGSDMFGSAANSATSAVPPTDLHQTPAKSATRLDPSVEKLGVETQKSGGHSPAPTSPVPPVPQVSVSAHSPVTSPSRGVHMPILNHLKQWLRHTTRRDGGDRQNVVDRTEASPSRPAPERRRLGFSAAAAGFRLHRDRKRGNSPPSGNPTMLCVDRTAETDSSKDHDTATSATSPTSNQPRPVLSTPRTDSRPASRGRQVSSRLAVPFAANGSPSVAAARSSARHRSASGSSPLRTGGPSSHGRRHSSLRGRKSASSSLSSIRSLRPQPGHSKASSTSSTTTTTTATTMAMTNSAPVGSNVDGASSSVHSTAAAASPMVSIGAAARIARASRLASPITGPPGGSWKMRRGRSLSSGSSSGTGGGGGGGGASSTSLTNPAILGSSLGASAGAGLSDPFSRAGFGAIGSPRVRRRPASLGLGPEIEFSRIGSTPPVSPGLTVSRRRPSVLSSPLGVGLGVNPGFGSNSGMTSLGSVFLRGRRTRSRTGRTMILEEEEDEGEDLDDEEDLEDGDDDDADEALPIEEVDQFDALEPGEEALYHEPTSPAGTNRTDDRLANSPPESPVNGTGRMVDRAETTASPQPRGLRLETVLAKGSDSGFNDSGAVLADVDVNSSANSDPMTAEPGRRDRAAVSAPV